MRYRTREVAVEIEIPDKPLGGMTLEKWIAASRPLDLDGVRWEDVPSRPISEDLVRCLTYFIDIENQTINYLRDLLVAGAAEDPDVAAFLPCWAYEEAFHGRALERFLNQYGIQLDRFRALRVRHKAGLREKLEALAARLLARYSPSFPAVYLTWGAVNEMSTLMGYQGLARRADHPVLTDITRRIMRDESRHFSFYYHMAQQRLKDVRAQRLTRAILSRFWTPVGQGVKPESEVRWIHRFVFEGPLGKTALEQVDRIIDKLPGLDRLGLLAAYGSTL